MITYSLEQYKIMFSNLDNNIKQDYNDPVPSIKDFNNWYDTFDQKSSQNNGLDSLLLFNNEAVPQFVRNILKRKYASNDEHINQARLFLERTAVYIAKNLYNEYEGLVNILPDLFDPNQPFYQKYGFPKVENLDKAMTFKVVLDENFKNSIEVGNCLDCLNENNEWEIALVEELSPTHTEIHIFWMTSEKREWISFESGAHRIAPFSTKVKGLAVEDSTSGTTFISNENIDPKTAAISENQHNDFNLIEDSWKFHVDIGDLIDVKDPFGVWYQAVIIDSKQIEVKALNNATVEDIATINAMVISDNDIAADSNIPENEEDNNNKRVKIDHSSDNDINSPTHLIADITLNDIEIITNEINSSESLIDSTVDDSMIDVVDSNVSIPETKYFKVTVRIAYIGFPERNDEWIDVDSVRIAKFNSMSFHRRGDNPIREELLYLIKPILSSNESSDIAVHRESSFVSSYFINVINVFGKADGFNSIMYVLMNNENKTSILVCIPLSIAVGNASNVLSKGFLNTYTKDLFLPNILPRLSGMSLPEIRQTPVEMIEASLKAIECLCVATLGRCEISGSWLEKPWLNISLNLLISPFLNRRLGGLKLLTELIRRGQNRKLYPNGLKVTYSNESIANNTNSISNDSDIKKIEIKDTLPNVSIRVIPILYSINLAYICERIISKNIVVNIFTGEQSHISLMARTTEILQVFISEGFLTNELINVLWVASFNNKEDQAMKVLIDLISHMSTDYILVLFDYVSTIPYNLVTSTLVDLLSSMCIRTRDLLLATNSISDTISIFSDSKLFQTHISLLNQLWLWCEDNSQCNDSVVSYIISKFESILSLSISTSIIDESYCSWDIHWDRCVQLIELAISNLRNNQSIVLGYKVIFSFINSFPVNINNILLYKSLPIAKVNRSSIVNYFESQYQIISIITSNILFSKQQLITAILDIPYSMLSNENDASGEPNGTNIHYNAEIQNVINNTILPNTRVSYKDLLNKAFDSLYLLIRVGDELELKQVVIQSIWENIVENAATMNEVERVVTFIKRLTTPLNNRNVKRFNSKLRSNKLALLESLNSPSSNSRNGNIDSDIQDDTSTITRKPLISNDLISYIFINLLCNNDKFISSYYYNDLAYQCTERLFLNININSNLILEYKDKNNSFVIIGPPDDLLYWYVFIDITLNTLYDYVAVLAMKFITLFPQKLSVSLLSTNENVNMRKKLLTYCMEKLQYFNDENKLNIKKIKRCLLLLDHILDESSYDSRHYIRPHGYQLSNIFITFKINAVSKSLSTYHHKVFDMLVTESVNDLINKVCTIINQTADNIKITIRAKDLTSFDKKKLLNQLGIVFSDTESLIVTEKLTTTPNNSNVNVHNVVESSKSDDEIVKAVRFEGFDNCNIIPNNVSNAISNKEINNTALFNEETSNSNIIDKASLPSSIVTQTPEYMELLFNLLDHTNSTLADDLWHLLNRLPTSPNILQGLLEINNNNFTEYLINACKHSNDHDINADETLSFSRLLYHLQIIEYLIQPIYSLNKRTIIESLFTDVSFDQIDEWVNKFLSKDGPTAMLYILNYISGYFNNYVGRDPADVEGSSSSMVLLALKLITKIIRALVLRMTVHTTNVDNSYSNINKFKYILDNCEYIISDKPDKSNIPIKSDQIIDIDIFEDSANLSAESKVDILDNGITQNEITTFNSIDNLYKDEWGYQLNNKIIPNFTVKDYESLIQKITVNLLITIRQFSNNKLFNLDSRASNSINERFIIQRRHDSITSIISHLYIIWSCCLLVTPTLLLYLVDESNVLLDIIKYGVLGELREINNGLIFYTTLGSTLSRGYIKIFEYIIIQTFGIDQSLTIQFINSLFIKLIDLLPDILYFDYFESSLSYSSLFQLICRLVELSVHLVACNDTTSYDITIITNDLLISITSNMYIKLTEAYKTSLQLFNDNKKAVIYYIDGILRVMTTICKYYHDVIEFLYQRNILSFLLNNCLGLTFSASPDSDVYICRDDLSKANVYEFIKEIINWGNDLLFEIILYLRPLHASIPIPASFSYDISYDAISKTGYVGLRNFGCTCYMNGLLQILYMIPEFRDTITNIPIISKYFPDTEDMRNDYIYQLQRLFLNLKYSKQKSYSPDDWVYCYKDETNNQPVNTSDQQDAQEFFQVLIDRLQNNYNKVYYKKDNNDNNLFLNNIIGVKVCDQMIKVSSDNTTTQSSPNHVTDNSIKERTESFVCLSVDVKGSKGLQDSLNKYIQGEYINEFQWDNENGTSDRVTIMKRQCISDLSNVLIFHLKRFELNFDTFLREKVNDFFPFPKILDMYPYTREGIMHNNEENSNCYPASFYQYELGGIVVHTGTADSGHYFSYIKDDSSRWYEFNDSIVKDFSESSIESECFGGKHTSHEYNKATDSFYKNDIPNPKSAYMLIYHRIQPIHESSKGASGDVNKSSDETIKESSAIENNVVDNQLDFMSVDNGEESKQYEVVSLTNHTIECINQLNKTHSLSSKLLSYSHISFLSDLTKILIEFSVYDLFSTNVISYLPTIIYELSTFGFKFIARLSYTTLINNYLDNLNEFITSQQSNTYKAIINITDHPQNISDLSNMISYNDYISNYSFFISLYIYNNLTTLLLPSLYCHETNVRHRISNLLYSNFVHIVTYYNNENWLMNMNEIKSNTISSNYRDIYRVNEINNNAVLFTHYEDDDLQLAIELSQSSTNNQVNNINYGLKILLELTNISNIRLISEHWRRSDAFTLLLFKIAVLNPTMIHLYLHREIISVIIDIILSDQSPLVDLLYERKGHKFAPSSYQNIYYINKEFELSNNHKNIPDWTTLLDLLNVLVSEYNNTKGNRFSNNGFMITNHNTRKDIITSWDLQCLHNKSFISICIRQIRYYKAISNIILLESCGDINFTDMICEVIFEYLSSGSYESTYQIFNLLDQFINVIDMYRNHRLSKLFPLNFNNNSAVSIISLLFNMKDQTLSHKYLCVCLSSLFHIMLTNNNLREWLCQPTGIISHWAPWMMKFSFQYMNRCAKEYEVFNQINTNNIIATGPYILVYGDSPSECELLWIKRSEKCFNLLRQLLLSVNAQLDNYMPEDAFIEPEITSDFIGPKQENIDEPVPLNDVLLTLKDGMTDEEIARALSLEN